MKKWLDFLSEQDRWRYNGVQTPAIGNSQVTSPNSMVSTAPDPDETEAWPGTPQKIPQADFGGAKQPVKLQDKVNWLDTMVQLINSKRIQQMELNTRINNRLNRLEKAAKLPPELNRNGNGNGATW